MDFKIRRNRFSHLQNLVAVNVERSKSDLLFSVIFPKTRTDKRDLTFLIQQIRIIKNVTSWRFKIDAVDVFPSQVLMVLPGKWPVPSLNVKIVITLIL